MRNTFAALMTEFAQQRDDLLLLYADIGNRLFNPLKAIAPERAINVGIAESNMISMAAGLAKEGLRPVCYTITPFTTTRNIEQIKIDVAYQNLPVIIVGTGSGLGYANLGPTHHSFEDIALMRSLPNMNIVSPADSRELRALFPQILAHDGPTYVRIGKKNEPDCYPHLAEGELPPIKLGEAYSLAHAAPSTSTMAQRNVVLFASGTILPLAQSVNEWLATQGIATELVSLATVKPLDTQGLTRYLDTPYWVVLEEHSINGGVSSAISEWLIDVHADSDVVTSMPKVARFGIPDKFIDQVSGRDAGLQKAGLTLDAIQIRLRRMLHLDASSAQP